MGQNFHLYNYVNGNTSTHSNCYCFKIKFCLLFGLNICLNLLFCLGSIIFFILIIFSENPLKNIENFVNYDFILGSGISPHSY